MNTARQTDVVTGRVCAADSARRRKKTTIASKLAVRAKFSDFLARRAHPRTYPLARVLLLPMTVAMSYGIRVPPAFATLLVPIDSLSTDRGGDDVAALPSAGGGAVADRTGDVLAAPRLIGCIDVPVSRRQ